jgi:hypothetical protein
MGTVPTLEDVRTYVRVPATALSDADQSARCAWQDPDYPDALAQAYLRRVQREIAARNLPLGMVGLEAEYGPQRLPYLDALVEEHERAYRRVVLA